MGAQVTHKHNKPCCTSQNMGHMSPVSTAANLANVQIVILGDAKPTKKLNIYNEKVVAAMSGRYPLAPEQTILGF